MMPTELERDGDFSKTVDAAGKMVVIKETQTGLPFQENKIPPNRITSWGQAILKWLPKPNFSPAASDINYNKANYKLNPISGRISLISFKDFLPKFLVLSISASVFCTRSPI
jgi:hypothetical protein